MSTLFGFPINTPFAELTANDLRIVVFGLTPSTQFGGMIKFNLAIESGDVKSLITGLRLINGVIKPPGARIGGARGKVIDHAFFGIKIRFLIFTLLKQAAEEANINISTFELATAPIAITNNRLSGLLHTNKLGEV